MIIGDAHDQTAPAFHQTFHLTITFRFAVAGLVASMLEAKTWMAGTSPAMTKKSTVRQQ
ncbi:hypothetical protein [Bradyrhizobium sp. USDA 313]|uniref:hypothetical protein n=1 Tax=Bradyrhizobium sp. USDA 313 TaxID=3156307 RepID=UPI003518EF48